VIVLSDSVDVKVPELGKVEEISIVEWKVSPGDEVTEGTEIAEIETMKSTFSVESPADGIIDDILIEQGEKTEVNSILATIIQA
jgi:pyruvate/2-oxoglutarate dehydrogenase complex dihydrolipoamide acyltransferase (E2) component